MSEKVEVRGDVAQLIGGNVNEAPRQSNVVNFHMGGDKTPVETLTDLQRKRIGALVKDLCAITQEEPLDIYRVILTDFGAERMKDMPRERYRDIVGQIGQWITENTKCAMKTSPQTSLTEPPRPSQSTKSPAQNCSICREKDISYERLQRVSRVQWILSAILTISCGLLLYKLPPPGGAASTGANYCFFEGQPYSPGSMVKTADGVTSECAHDIASTSSWKKTSPTR